MNEFLILLQAKLDEAKSKGNVNADISSLQTQLDKLKLQVELDPKVISKLTKQLENILNQKITVSNISIDSNSAVKSAQQTGQQISNVLTKEMTSASKSTEKVLRDFSELNDVKRKFVDGHAAISKEELSNAEQFYNTIRKAFSEFGQVTVSKGEMTDGVLDSMRVKIEQVKNEAKITRDFILSFNKADAFGTHFKLVDDDTIRSTEKMIQHLNEEKNIVNVTNEEANSIKQKLAEQEKFYKNIKNEVNVLYKLKTKLLSADELQTAELEKQIKQTKERISYNTKQIDKKDLRDTSLDREINNLEVAKQKQLALATAKAQDTINTKQLAQAEKETNAVLKERQTLTNQVNKIQLSMETGGYDAKVDTLIAKTRQWTDSEGQARISTNELSAALKNLNDASNALSNNNTVANQNALIAAEKELDVQIKIVTNSVRKMNAEFATDSKVVSLHNRVADFMSKNGKTVKYFGTELNDIFNQTLQGAKLTNEELTILKQRFIDVQNTARATGKLGNTFFQTIRKGMSSFSYWTSSTFIVMKTIHSIKKGISTIKELDTALVDLKKTTSMTNSELESFYYKSNEIAKQSGVTTAEIINQAAAWSRLGYSSSEAAIKMAKYSSMFASISPGMNVDTATDGLVSIMKAFDIGNDNPDDVLDGIMSKVNIIGNTAATSNAEIVNMLTKSSSAMKEANNTLEETIALETAAVEITRDDDSVGMYLPTNIAICY